MGQKIITDLQLISSLADGVNFPVDDTIQTYRATMQQVYDYLRPKFASQSAEISNLAVAASVGSNQLTIEIKTKAGSDPSATDKVRVGMRSATITSGAFNLRELAGALSLVISSGSTLGQVSGSPAFIWLYLLDNGGNLELAASHQRYSEDQLVSTTAEGAGGGADSATAIYSAAARTDVPIRCIGYILNTQATAGTWATSPAKIQLIGDFRPKGPTVQLLTAGTTYIKPAGVTRLRVRAVGGGGGGAGGGTSTPGSGGNGGATTFDTISAGGGTGGTGTTSQVPGAGGTPSGGDINIYGAPGFYSSIFTGVQVLSPSGGASLLGAGGRGVSSNTAGNAGQLYGGGGAGGGGPSSGVCGASGGGGAYVEKWILTPAASYSYAIGSGGSAGSGQSGSSAGGAGSAGVIIVEEFYD